MTNFGKCFPVLEAANWYIFSVLVSLQKSQEKEGWFFYSPIDNVNDGNFLVNGLIGIEQYFIDSTDVIFVEFILFIESR